MDISEIYKRIKINESDCWEWQGAKNAKGYGLITFYDKASGKRRCTSAHRYMYALKKRIKLQRSECVCHRCDNPACINPRHMFVGSPKDNMQDMIAKGRRAKRHAYHHRVKTIPNEVAEGIRNEPEGKRPGWIAAKYNVSVSYVSKIRTGKLKRTLK